MYWPAYDIISTMFDGQGVETDVIRLSNTRIQILLTTGVHASFRGIICKLTPQTTHICIWHHIKFCDSRALQTSNFSNF